jgi:hypothetical protein
MFTDIVGFTKIMGDDESTALSILENQQSLINPIVEERKGTIIKKMGDGMLIEFPSTVEAVECAILIQNSIKSYNGSVDNLEFHIRIGIHLGDVVVLGDDILGEGVNIASRIEPLANSDGICITDAVYQSIKSKVKLKAKRIDEVDLKHIDEKYIIYKIPDENISDKEELLSDKNNPKIKILEIKNISKTSEEFFKSLYKSCIFGIISFFVMIAGTIVFDLLDFIIYRDFTRSVSKLILGDINTFILGLAGFILFLTFVFRKKEYKIIFKDIRNVDSILNHMITEDVSSIIKYEIVEQKGNTIVYYPYSLKFSAIKAYEDFFNRYMFKIFPFMKDFETLELTFDGNVVIVKGMANGVDKLKKRLKILELI